MTIVQFKPLLAREMGADEKLPFPMLASPKLDGIRCIVRNGVAYSRSMKPIPNRRIADHLPLAMLEGLDGELIAGDPCAPGCMQTTQSAVMSHDGDLSAVRFHVFDWTDNAAMPYAYRFETAANMVGLLPESVPVSLVMYRAVSSARALAEYEAARVAEGYEGTMLRDPSGRYKHGRTAGKGYELLKVKRWADSEAEIVAVHPLMHNANALETNELGNAKRSSAKAGMVPTEAVGSFDVRDVKTGVTFNLGGGPAFTAEARASLWAGRHFLPGTLVKYRYQPAGTMEAPRFPTFIGFRHPDDLGE